MSRKYTITVWKNWRESAKILQAIREQLPVIHAQYRQHRGTGQRQEIEALVDMQAAVRRLWGEFPSLDPAPVRIRRR